MSESSPKNDEPLPEPSADPEADRPSSAPRYLPRLVQRGLPYDQSHNKVRVGHDLDWEIVRLLRHDWFHAFLRLPTYYSLPILLSIWTIMLFIFAGIYMAIDKGDPAIDCGLGSNGSSIDFGPAFAFALEMGYGLPSGTNAFFENCQGLQAAIYFQMVWSMLYNAFLFAFVYNRLGRCELRGVQVVLAKKAIVSIVDGQARLQIRIYDVDAQHPVVEAHVRILAVAKERPVPRALRVLQPNDELGGMLFLSMPSVAIHHIDAYSMLHPPSEETPVRPSGLTLRQVDSVTASREECICPVCGESYGTYERWIRHVRFQQIVEEKDSYPVEGTHLSLTEKDLEPPKQPTIAELQNYFEQEIAEIICLVEGIDPLMSGTFQALQSYRYEDILWDNAARYKPCLVINGEKIRVDLDAFHEIEQCASSRPQPATKISLRTHDSLLVNHTNAAETHT